MNAILTLLYPALVKQGALLLGKFPGHALQPEDLLHMAVERILRRPPPEQMHHAHIIRGLVQTLMKRVLVDEWRRNSASRGRQLTEARNEDYGAAERRNHRARSAGLRGHVW